MLNMKLARCLLGSVALLEVLTAGLAHAGEAPVGILGKEQWLFYRYEMSDNTDEAATGQTIDLIQRFNRVLAQNDITLAVAMVPIKMRIYAEYLPDDVKMSPYMEANYGRMEHALRQGGVHVLDLNAPFLSSPLRNGGTPLFYRLDTHWSLTGAMVAAEAVKAGIEGDSMLKKVYAATQQQGYSIAYGKRKIPSAGRDLIGQLPPNSIKFAYEQVTPVSVLRGQPGSGGLLGSADVAGISVLGSSYSKDWTGFADALRYVLQRDVLSMGVGADQGSWIGMESYVRDDAFQTHPPKLLIWEMPERDMKAPPDYKYRDARYQSNNTEWLLRVSALVQSKCTPSPHTVRIASMGMAARQAISKGQSFTSGSTAEGEYLEIEFDRPLESMDYLAARITTNGSRALVVEGVGEGAGHRLTLEVAGDGQPHMLKTPLLFSKGGVSKIRLFPGKTTGFTLESPQVCRQPENLLK